MNANEYKRRARVFAEALIENQSRKIQELGRQLELLAGRLETIEKHNHEHELRLQYSDTHRGQNLRINNQPLRIETIDKCSNFHLDTKNRFNALRDELKNNINSPEEQTIQTSNEHNPHQTQYHTQPAGIFWPFRNFNESTNKKCKILMQLVVLRMKKQRSRRNLTYFSLETASSKDRKPSSSGG
ncbi:hypothetical protein FHG87_006077 [Trinorchestia longiramus]|nr:hypothetical protein FHG87_006077 [Trinorchestia longiramus]